MSNILGTWNAQMKSVLGNGDFTLLVSDNPAAATLTAPEGVQEASEIVLGDNSITFVTDIEQPMKLHVVWKLSADGDELVGTAKAGVFPAAKVRGTRS